jgi:hypothetical protein
MEQVNVKSTEVKTPKKRGRKPTGKIFQMEKGIVRNIDTDNECIIAYLPLSMNDTKDISDNSEVVIEKTITTIKSNVSIMNDLKNIISHTSECSSDIDTSKFKLSTKKHDDDVVHKLKSKIEELEKLLYDNINFDKLNELCIDMTKGNLEDIHCWWCCHTFDHIPIGLPDNFREEMYHTYGYFCSFNCAKAYNLEHYDNKTEEKNCLLLSLNKRLTNDASFIKPANPRQSLKMFGGHQTIEIFRKDFKILAKNSILIYPPSKPLKLYVEEEYKHKIVRFQQNIDYKVKRTKPLARTANSLHNLLKTKD